MTAPAQPPPSETALLLASDLEALAGGPVEEADLDDMPVFENPDPRGPCGTVLPAYPTTSRAVRIFTASTVVAVNTVRPADAAAVELHTALADDLHAGCRPHESTTNTGATQRVDMVAPVAGLAGDTIGWTARVTVGGQSVWLASISARDASWHSVVQIQSHAPVDSEVVRATAAAVVERMRAAESLPG